ncbi:MAG: hypothetical protein IKM35_02200 [Bacteroidaceae bacterium]|nr:hypothetical protein [Bacteroidaceae bacterium]
MTEKYHKHSFGIISLVLALFIAGMIVIFTACHNTTTPLPHGYFRIAPYPSTYKSYTLGDINLQINDSARCTTPATHTRDGVHWLNIQYPRYNATIYLSYIPLTGNLDQLMNESIELVYRQNINTEQVEAFAYEDITKKLYATLYTLSPESATPVQFIVTDSSEYLLRGALYFDTPVKSDSIAPSLQYIEDDIIQLIESIRHNTL